MRHHATDIHRVGTVGDVTRARFYISVNTIANFVPFVVSKRNKSPSVCGHSPNGLAFTEMEVILDTQNSVLLSGLTADSTAGS